MPGAILTPQQVGPWTTLDEHVQAAIRRRAVAKPATGAQYVATRYLGHAPWNWLRRFDDALTRPMPPGKMMRVIQAPVDQGKSTRLQAHVVRKIAQNRRIRIGYGMWTGKLARQRTAAVRRVLLTNTLLNRDFWDPTHGPFFRSEADAGSEGSFRVLGADVEHPTPTLSAIGLKENFEGEKYDVLIFDDAQNRNAMTSEADRELAWRVLTSTALGRLEKPHGELWLVGAPWHERDMQNRSAGAWNPETGQFENGELVDAVGVAERFDSILGETGIHPAGSPFAGKPMFRPLCPERYGEHGEGLFAMGYGTSIFALKFRCNVKAATGGAFVVPEFAKPQRLGMDGDLGPVQQISMGADLNASTAEDADYTAVVSLGRTRSGKVIVLRIARRHMRTGWHHLIASEAKAVRSAYPDARFVGVRMEDTVFQDEARMNLLRDYPEVHAYPVKRVTDKVVRLSTRLEPWFNSPGRFYILEGIAHGFDLRDEARMFPYGTFDVLDATEAALQPWDSLKQAPVSAVLDL